MSLLAQVFWRLLNISLLGGIFVLLVVLLRKLFRRSTRGVFLILWMLLAIRLLFPFMIDAPFGVLPGKESIKTELFMENKEESASAAKDGKETLHGGEGIPKEIDSLQGNDNPATAESILPETGEKTLVPGGVNEAVEKTEGIGSADAETVVSTILKVAAVVWLAGLGCLLLYALWHGIRLYRMTRIHVVREDGVWVVDEVTTPFVYGIFRPRIVLPSSLPAEKEPFVLAHEREHLRHGDALWKLFAFLLLSVYWFNPLIWLAYVLFCRDLEMACDERAVRHWTKEERLSYAETLLFFDRQNMKPNGLLAFAEKGRSARIKEVLKMKKPILWVTVALIAVAVTLITLLFLQTRSIRMEEENSPIRGSEPSENVEINGSSESGERRKQPFTDDDNFNDLLVQNGFNVSVYSILFSGINQDGREYRIVGDSNYLDHKKIAYAAKGKDGWVISNIYYRCDPITKEPSDSGIIQVGWSPFGSSNPVPPEDQGVWLLESHYLLVGNTAIQTFSVDLNEMKDLIP